jgi:hypothetical protein
MSNTYNSILPSWYQLTKSSEIDGHFGFLSYGKLFSSKSSAFTGSFSIFLSANLLLSNYLVHCFRFFRVPTSTSGELMIRIRSSAGKTLPNIAYAKDSLQQQATIRLDRSTQGKDKALRYQE